MPKLKIHGFSAGSILVHFDLIFPQASSTPINIVGLVERLSHEVRSDNSNHLNIDLTKEFLTIEDKNECLDPSLHDCSADAQCFNTLGSFTCKCNKNFIDQGEPELPGRKCVKDWTGIRPEIRTSELDLWVVIVFCTIAFLLMALPVSFCIWKKKCKSKKVKRTGKERMSGISNDAFQEPHVNEITLSI